MARTYENFDIELVASGTTYEARFRSLPGEPTITLDFPLEEHEFASFLAMFGKHQRRRMESPEFSRVRAVGGRLFDCLFPNELRISWVEVANQAKRNGKGMRIRIDLSQAEDLVTIPWEYLYRAESDDFLSLSNWTPVVRFLDVAEPLGAAPLNGPLKILVMISDPIERRGSLDIDREWQQLNEALVGPISRDEIQLHRLPNGQLESLQVALQQSDYHVFHFIGHGEYSEEYDDGVLALEDARGRESHVSGSSLGTYLRDCLPLRLVVLNNCEGAATSESDPFAGSAQSLLKQGIPAIVAMQFEITDRAAIDFARGFYTSLGNGFPVDAALAEARKVIRGGPTRIEFGSPVLYLSAHDGMVFTTEHAPVIPEETPGDLTVDPGEGKTLEKAEELLLVTRLGPVEADPGEVQEQSVDDADVDTVEIEGLEGPRVPATDLPEKVTDSDSEPPVVGEGEAVSAPAIEKAEPDTTVIDQDRMGRGGSEKSKRRALIASMVIGGLILVALIVRFLPDDGGTEVTTTPSVSTTPSVTTATSAPAVPSPFVDWSRTTDIDSSLGGVDTQVMFDVTEGGPGLVAVGKAGATGAEDVAVWTSVDGTSWTRVPEAEISDPESTKAEMRSVVPWDSGLVAVGVADSAGQVSAAVWISMDGNSWSRVPDASGTLGGANNQVMRSVTVWKSGLVAVGWEIADENVDGVIWTSPDGVDWTRVEDPEGVFGGDSHQHIHDVAAGGPGLVAVGDDNSQGDLDVAIWSSEDAITWTQVSSDQAGMSGPGDQLANSLKVSSEGQVLAGGFTTTSQGGRDAAVWMSTNGTVWSAMTQHQDDFGGSDDQEVHGLAVVGTGWVAVGWDGTPEEKDAVVWTTSEDTPWTRVDAEGAGFGGPGAQQFESVALMGVRLVGVGVEKLEAADQDAAVWLGTP